MGLSFRVLRKAVEMLLLADSDEGFSSSQIDDDEAGWQDDGVETIFPSVTRGPWSKTLFLACEGQGIVTELKSEIKLSHSRCWSDVATRTIGDAVPCC